MALIQVEMNQVNSGGTSDVIVPNAIANNDGTSSGFSTDSNNTLVINTNEYVERYKQLINSPLVFTANDNTNNSIEFNVGSSIFSLGKRYKVIGYIQTDDTNDYYGDTYFAFRNLPTTSSNVNHFSTIVRGCDTFITDGWFAVNGTITMSYGVVVNGDLSGTPSTSKFTLTLPSNYTFLKGDYYITGIYEIIE